MNFFHDTQNDVLIYEQMNPLASASMPGTAQSGRYTFVPRTLANSQVLRFYGYPVPPVITDKNYDWPAQPGFRPYESQKVTANFVALHRRCFVLSDMGSGKTAAALWAADWLMRQYPAGTCRVLVVAPLSILQRKWADDIFRMFLHRRTFRVLHGTAEKRRALLAEPADFYLVNHDGVGVGAHTQKRLELDGFSKDLAERSDIRIVIADEASAYKDATTKRHRIARLAIAKREYVWLMTGTPVPNAPTDAYGLARLVNNCFGQSFTSFQASTMYKISQFRWVPQKEGYQKAYKLLTPSIRIDIRDIWDAPEMVTRQREVPLTIEQKKLFADLKRDFQIALASGKTITTPNEAAARLKFSQVSLGAVYDETHKAHTIDAAPRLDELLTVLEQAPGKCLVFAPFTSVVNRLHAAISKRWMCRIVNGAVSQKERSQIFSDFQNTENPRVLVADPATMSHGLDLFAARTVIWYGPVEKSELYAQANHRAHRPGQKFPVVIVQIVSNPLEREIFRRLENNLSLQGTLLDLAKQGVL